MRRNFGRSILYGLFAVLPVSMATALPLSESGTVAGGEWQYHPIEVPAGAEGLRLVVHSDAVPLGLYLREGQNPTASSLQGLSFSGSGYSSTIVRSSAELSGGTWYIGVRNTDTDSVDYTLQADEVPSVLSLEWDDGDQANAHTVSGDGGGYHYFTITTRDTALGAWRKALNVDSGQAELFIRQQGTATPSTNNLYESGLTETGGGIVQALGTSGVSSTTWHLTVAADAGSDWTLVAGDVPVTDLGVLAEDDASGTETEIPGEGVVFLRTTVPQEALAWRVWLRADEGGSDTWMGEFDLRENAVPVPGNNGNWDLWNAAYDFRREGQALFVPGEISPGGGSTYYLAVRGEPGEEIYVDSRWQPVTDTAFGGLPQAYGGGGSWFHTFRLTVPSNILGWEVSASPDTGDAFVAARLGEIPSDRFNHAYSEVEGGVDNSFTLVPPLLSDGTYFITVYGEEPSSFELQNREPIVTTIDYESSTLNDDPGRTGWRYFQMLDSEDQVAGLGWLLELENEVPGTRIAIRRNNLPGSRNSRTDGSSSTTDHNFDESVQGFLQSPAHEADAWYIGIYADEDALGEFTLHSSSLSAPERDPDGTEDQVVTELRPTEWDYYRIEIPETLNGQEILGWELRVTNDDETMPVTAIQRDTLPDGTFTTTSTFGRGETWASHARLTRSQDWTGRSQSATGTFSESAVTAVGMGQPLEPGTYYVGFRNNSSSNTADFTWSSRLIGLEGSGMAYEVAELGFDNQSVTGTLEPRAVDYYYVDIPAGASSWRVHLDLPEDHEGQLFIRKDFLPNTSTTALPYANPARPLVNSFRQSTVEGLQVRMNTDGDERFDLWPQSSSADALEPGRYYLMVVSEGRNPPANNRIGTGSIDYTLRSVGEAPVNDLGPITEGDEIVLDGESYPGVGINYYRFQLPDGLVGVEIRLEDKTGNPVLRLREDFVPPAIGLRSPNVGFPQNLYGQYNARIFQNFATDFLYLTSPDAGYYTLSITEQSGTSEGSYRLVIRGIEPAVADVDGFSDTVDNLPEGEWVYYEVEVPEDILGWEIRVTEWEEFRPWIVVRRDALPDQTSGGGLNVANSFTWGSGNFVAIDSGDWTDRSVSADGGQANESYVLSLPMGQPLEAGTYYVGFQSRHINTPTSFTWTSNAVGAEDSGYHYETRPLAFDGDGSSVEGVLEPRQVAYYAVEIPDETYRSWQFELKLPEEGHEAQIYARREFLPNSERSSGSAANPGTTQLRLDKPGDEHFVMWPVSGDAYIAGGTYYLMVVGEGQDPEASNRIGEGPVDYELISHGEADVQDLGLLPVAGDTLESGSYGSGQQNYYQFEVPESVLALELRLEDREGNPRMNLIEDVLPPATANWYGNYSGRTSDVWRNHDLITLAGPEAGIYTLAVAHGSGTSFTPGYDAGAYTLRITAAGAVEFDIDGFTDTVQDLGPQEWTFYRVDVPEQIDGEAVHGWELRVTDWSGDEPPAMVVRRDELPENLNDQVGTSGGLTSWASGRHMVASGNLRRDWTGRPYSADGAQEHEQILMSIPMGQPLQPGEYYVGFRNRLSGNAPVSFSWSSKAVGPENAGMSYEIRVLDYDGGEVSGTLSPRDVAYYAVDIEEGTESWEVELEVPEGHEALLFIRSVFVPYSRTTSGFAHDPSNWQGTGSLNEPQVRLAVPGNQRFVLWPRHDQDHIIPGRYYLLVAGAGQEPADDDRIGTGDVSYTLLSKGPATVTDLGTLPAVGQVSEADVTYRSGEVNYYRFELPEGVDAFELHMVDRTGTPHMHLGEGSLPGAARYFVNHSGRPVYGQYAGRGVLERSYDIMTRGNPGPGTYALTIAHGADPGYGTGGYTLRLTTIQAAELAFTLDPSDPSNSASGQLVEGQSDFYTVPVSDNVMYYEESLPVDEEEVLAWRLRLPESEGQAEMRVRPGNAPEGNFAPGQTNWHRGAMLVVPPYLESGDWYVEVRGVSATNYTLISEPVVLSSLQREVWEMPPVGEATDTPGLDGATFADTGYTRFGDPLFGDQGVNLDSGDFHLFAIEVPEDNGALLRTILDNLSGDTDLYLRPGHLPSASHPEAGNGSGVTTLHRMTGTDQTERGAWVPFDVRESAVLDPGLWFFKVYAASDTNARYRLRLSHHAEQVVQDLALNGGSYEDQILAANDWRYYRVDLPEGINDTPDDWTITFSESSGNVVMYIRDSAPPGLWDDTGVNTRVSYSNPRDWTSDGAWQSNRHNYRRISDSGTYTIKGDELQLGKSYYIGFRASTDAVFSVESEIGAATIQERFGLISALGGVGGRVKTELAPGEIRTWRIEFPAEAVRWRSVAQHDPGIELYVGPHQLLPYLHGEGNNFGESDGAADWSFERNFFSSYRNFENTFYLTAVNTGGETRDLDLFVDWRGPSDFEIDFTIVGGGTVVTDPDDYVTGEPVQLTAVPLEGGEFLGWSGDLDSTENPVTLTPYGELSITATFEGVDGPEVYSAWISEYPDLSGDDAGFSANPAGDGIINALKFVLGLDPRVDASAGMPLPELDSVGAEHFLVFEVTRNPDAFAIDGLDLIIDYSEGLSTGTWDPVDGAYVVEDSPERLKVRIPVAGSGFLRLRLDGVDALE